MFLQRELEFPYQIGRANISDCLNNRVMRNDQCDTKFEKPCKRDVRNCRTGNLTFILGKLAEKEYLIINQKRNILQLGRADITFAQGFYTSQIYQMFCKVLKSSQIWEIQVM